MKQEKLESILTTAKKMFAKYGLKKTNLDEIARVARVAKGTIYNYFGNKEQVYLEVLKRESDEIVEQILLSADQEVYPAEKLSAFCHAKFRHMRHATNMLNLDREGTEKYFPAAESIRNGFFEREVKIIDTILRQGVDAGAFRLNDASLTARAIAHALRGFELNWLVQEGEEKIEHYLNELLAILFSGMMVDQGVRRQESNKPTA